MIDIPTILEQFQEQSKNSWQHRINRVQYHRQFILMLIHRHNIYFLSLAWKNFHEKSKIFTNPILIWGLGKEGTY